MGAGVVSSSKNDFSDVATQLGPSWFIIVSVIITVFSCENVEHASQILACIMVSRSARPCAPLKLCPISSAGEC